MRAWYWHRANAQAFSAVADVTVAATAAITREIGVGVSGLFCETYAWGPGLQENRGV